MTKVALGTLLYGIVMVLPHLIDTRFKPSPRPGIRRLLPVLPQKGEENAVGRGWNASSYVVGLGAIFVGILVLLVALLDAMGS